jgi:hypothetical protein
MLRPDAGSALTSAAPELESPFVVCDYRRIDRASIVNTSYSRQVSNPSGAGRAIKTLLAMLARATSLCMLSSIFPHDVRPVFLAAKFAHFSELLA